MMQRLLPVAFSLVAAGVLTVLLMVGTASARPAQETVRDVALWVTPLGLSFGRVDIGAISPPQTITLVNVGTSTIRGFTPQMPTDPDFQLTSTCADGLAPGAQCTYTVRFAPTTQGWRTASSHTETDVAIVDISMNGIGVAPEISYDARLLDFGALPLGAQSPAQAVTIRNVGSAAVTNFTNPPLRDAQFRAETQCPDSLAPGSTCTYSFDFRPTRVGKTETRATPGSTAQTMDIGLMGWGSPAYRVTAQALDFGSVISGTISGALSVTLENLTVVPLTDVTVTPPAQAQFQMNALCAGSIAPGASCTWSYTFAPTATGLFTGSSAVALQVPGMAGAEEVAVSLHGVGCAGAVCPVAPLTVNPTALDLGTAAMGSQSLPLTLTVTNNGIYTAAFTSNSVTDPQFWVARRCGRALAPGASCTMTARFRPFRPGAVTAEAVTGFDLVDAEGRVVMTDTYALALRAFGIPGLAYSPRELSFPPTNIGDASEPITVTIRSLGGTLSSFAGLKPPPPFTNTTSCNVDVLPLGTCHDVVRFAPFTTFRYTVTQGVLTTLGMYELTLSGESTRAELWTTPTVLNFGTVTVGQTSAPQRVTVTNTGAAPLTLAAAPQPSSMQYELQSDCPQSLAPAASCTLTYRFTPGVAGVDDTQALISTDADVRTIRLLGYAATSPDGNGDGDPHRIFLPNVRTE